MDGSPIRERADGRRRSHISSSGPAGGSAPGRIPRGRRDEVPQVQFERRRTAEDTILAKLEWYRAGGDVSDRQWSDVRGILPVQRGKLDLDFIRGWGGKLGLRDLIERLEDDF